MILPTSLKFEKILNDFSKNRTIEHILTSVVWEAHPCCDLKIDAWSRSKQPLIRRTPWHELLLLIFAVVMSAVYFYCGNFCLSGSLLHAQIVFYMYTEPVDHLKVLCRMLKNDKQNKTKKKHFSPSFLSFLFRFLRAIEVRETSQTTNHKKSTQNNINSCGT